MYSVPWNKRWRPHSIDAQLKREGIPSRIEGDNLIIEYPRKVKSWLNPLEILIAFLRPVTRMTLLYRSDQIINRLKMHTDGDFPFDAVHEIVESAMRMQGFRSIGKDATVREIVLECCRPCSRLARRLDALDELDSDILRREKVSTDDYCQRRNNILCEIEKLILESDDFADPDFKSDELARSRDSSS